MNEGSEVFKKMVEQFEQVSLSTKNVKARGIATQAIDEIKYVKPNSSRLAGKELGKKTMNPDMLIQEAIAEVKDKALQEFLSAVVQEPELNQILSGKHVDARGSHKYEIQYLQHAARLAAYWSVQARLGREVVYVAAFVEGLKQLCQPWVVGPSSADNVVFTIVRAALYRFDDKAPLLSQQFRLIVGWGNEDDLQGGYIPELQKIVKQALRQVRQKVSTEATFYSSKKRD